MNKRNYIYNLHGGIDCEIEFGRIEAVEAQDAVYEDRDGEQVLISEATPYIPAIEGQWLPHTLDEIPIDVEISPYVAPDKTKEELISAVAARRYAVETGGIIRGGKRINTTRESQSMVTAAYQALSSGLISTTNWKADDGTFSAIDFDALKPVATIIAQHVADCFTAEMNHLIAVNALANQSEINNYDVSTGWPS
jgi:hypothetical protein